MRALIDGDIIQYRCGFASDKVEYVVDDKAGGAVFKYKKEANAFCDKYGFDKDTAITRKESYEPVEHCLHSVKLVIKGIMESIDAADVKIFLTGAANFRDDLYTEYKANRDRSRKPHHFKAIEEYLINVWGAEKVVGVEADDAMGWAQWKEIQTSGVPLEDTETCICTLDKDLNMIPGWHFDWTKDNGKGLMYMTDEQDSLYYFFQQWLTGDPADNIPGLPKVGEKTAQKILEPFKQRLFSPRALYEMILREYTSRGFTPDKVNLIGDLLWIQREPMQSWDKYMGLTKLRQETEGGS